ncbi:D-Ala-D-Ala carboxypeptidase family metallohydrolase [uncultured Bacteroides sp.]|uniref:D-Ala-D-Ala carboxypeptidase family metallohydrolase n=1 Tax=uncultured Bacteroides sp. TaxID=162156 RepID=UPI002596F1C3|nr:D-Ala-D-Ala carboxypeptidase family metallohydrolase [uncultured Bacteroides sp.]
MKYFAVSEFVRSETADKRGIDNRLPKDLLPNVQALVDNVLDPLREAWGKPIIVSSGYRCPALNKAVKGSATSDHMRGCASDITVGSRKENKRLFNLIQSLGLPFDQLIWEKGNLTGPDWVHVSFRRDGENRKQIFAL